MVSTADHIQYGLMREKVYICIDYIDTQATEKPQKEKKERKNVM